MITVTVEHDRLHISSTPKRFDVEKFRCILLSQVMDRHWPEHSLTIVVPNNTTPIGLVKIILTKIAWVHSYNNGDDIHELCE